MLRDMFGEDNVACISTYGTFQIKGLLKDVGRVYDIDHKEINQLNKRIDSELKILYKDQDKSTIVIKYEDIVRVSPTYRAFIEKYEDGIAGNIKKLYGLNRHIGRHACGLVIGDDLPSEMAVFQNRGILQTSFTQGIINKHVEEMGFVKFDLLSLSTLNIIDKALTLIAERHDMTYNTVKKKVDPTFMDADDMNVMKTVFWDGNFTGIFQCTSKGMQKLAMRVQPDCFNDVAAIGALYRPGPLKSNMHKLYADHKHNPEMVKYMHPLMEDILKETHGCLVYQEQMLNIGSKIGKLSMKDTNRLRKLLLKKDKSKKDDYLTAEKNELIEKFSAGCLENGMSKGDAKELWEMLEAFGGYGFNACLTADTIVYRTGANDICNAEVSIGELWRAQESRTPTGGMTSIAKKMKYAGVMIQQLDEDGRIRTGRTKKIHHNGAAHVFKITTENGKTVRATSNHRFLTPTGYKTVEELSAGDELIVVGEREVYERKGHRSTAKGNSYEGMGFQEGEQNPAFIDGRTKLFQEAIEAVSTRSANRCEFCGSSHSGSHGLEFAHDRSLQLLDFDYTYYHSENNIFHLCNSCHKKFDYEKGERKKRWAKGLPSKVEAITSIVYDETEDVFDVEMNTENHNFVANGIVSHNSHAKCYGMITMQTAWLRTYYPLEYFAAVLTHGKADELQTYVDDIKRQGYKILPVDINKSKTEHVIEGNAIRLALGSVLGVGPAATRKIIANQPYENFRDYLYRTGGGKTATLPLIKVGAFSDLEENSALVGKRYEIWMDYPKLRTKKNREEFEGQYFGTTGVKPHSIAKQVEFENELLGFNLRGTPFKLFDRGEKIDILRESGTLMSYSDFVESDSDLMMIPVVVKDFKERAQKRGGMMAFVKFGDIDGVEFEAPCFATIWTHVAKKVVKGNVYLITFNRKLDEPRNLVIGKSGWSHSPYACAEYVINLDEVVL